MKKIILSFILIFAVSIGIIPISYADSLIQLDERKIKLLEEYAMRIPYFYGDEVYSAQFARKSICLIYDGYAYRQGLKNGEFTALPLVGAARYIPQEDVNYEYRLIFGTDIPPNIQPNSAAMTYSGDLVYNTIFCNNEYEDKYILQTGDAPDDEYIIQQFNK